MAATTVDINTPRKFIERLAADDSLVAANTSIPAGALFAINGSGHAVNGADTAGLKIIGRAPRRIANTTGAAAKVVPAANAEAGVFWYATSGANALTVADVGGTAYVLDNQTVVRAAGTTNSIVAGAIDAFEAINGVNGVWIKINC